MLFFVPLLGCAHTPPAAATESPPVLSESDREVWAGEAGELSVRLTSVDPDGTNRIHGRFLVTDPAHVGSFLLQPIVEAGLTAGQEEWQWDAQAWPATFQAKIDPAATLTTQMQTRVTHAKFKATASQVAITPDADDRFYQIKRGTQVLGWLWVKLDPQKAVQELRWYKQLNVPGALFIMDDTGLTFTAPAPVVPTQAYELEIVQKP